MVQNHDLCPKERERIRRKEYRERNKEQIRNTIKNWLVKNEDRAKEMWATYREVNKEAISAKKKEWYAKNKEKIKKRRAEYRAKNSVIRTMQATIRKRVLKHAIPKWISVGDLLLVYRACPPGYHVDHIIPIKGIDPVTKQHVVCGLHCPNNLQYLSMEDNLTKWAWFPLE
jgi:hypothetical protein